MDVRCLEGVLCQPISSKPTTWRYSDNMNAAYAILSLDIYYTKDLRCA